MKDMKRMKKVILTGVISVSILLSSCSFRHLFMEETNYQVEIQGTGNDFLEEIPEYTGLPYVEINYNDPDFTEKELTHQSYEKYSQLDELGRCQTAIASIGLDLMPEEERKSISEIKPSGWQSIRYENVEGENLYNRCHLIGFQLTGENANEQNLITGTRYMNVEGMLPFENMVADYVKETGNHVLYQVTPIYEGENLVASGVHMKAQSVEDQGKGISFNVYCYNVQPGIEIDYKTGESKKVEDVKKQKEQVYILNTNTKKFHQISCSSVDTIQKDNRKEFKGNREEVISQGYDPCGVCHP